MSEKRSDGGTSLADLGIGEVGRVREVVADRPMRRKMMDMGITKGAAVELSKKSPLGDPLEIKTRGYKITIRKKSAEGVLV
jgi:ferrous iron transport protein A